MVWLIRFPSRTDANDQTLTEVVTAPGTSATVESTGYFKTLTSATPSATIGADTFDIGWVDEIASQIIPLDRKSPFPCNIGINVTGTADWTIQKTFQDLYNDYSNIVWDGVSGLTGMGTDDTGEVDVGATGMRLILNSYSSGAEVKITYSQPGNYS